MARYLKIFLTLCLISLAEANDPDLKIDGQEKVLSLINSNLSVAYKYDDTQKKIKILSVNSLKIGTPEQEQLILKELEQMFKFLASKNIDSKLNIVDNVVIDSKNFDALLLRGGKNDFVYLVDRSKPDHMIELYKHLAFLFVEEQKQELEKLKIDDDI